MSMSAPFDPEQQGSDVPVDGSDASELEVEEGRSADGSDSGSDSDSDSGSVSGGVSSTSDEADASPERLQDEDEAGGGPVFRRPQPGDRLHAGDLSEELSEDSELDS
ncbi:hypothetical protein BIU98_05785 [Curtobacterium sp. MMLR14_010]|uniref:hypothetical protein n=1 Tax=Curtobacterium sp. MMLR14_010 TaxID=1898743 RepID=UPI0008DDBCD6|nr:hypothetical protein [Curtobacterium sp. MMLR14_010]OII33952.1 hypothetical protein BIU98_05785 [Curtobacterium sp. MMLR14_010]